RQLHRVAGADDRGRRFEKGIDRRRLAARAVLHVVDRHAHDGRRLRQWRTQAHARNWYALSTGRGVEARAIFAKPRNETGNEVVRTGMRDVSHRGGDIHDAVALHYAELEVVEIGQLHILLLACLAPRGCCRGGLRPLKLKPLTSVRLRGRLMELHVTDMHTAGEPVRIVTG